MDDVVRIAPGLTDDDIVEWIGTAEVSTQAVARRFAWSIEDARKHLTRLQKEKRLVSELKDLRFGDAETGGRHRMWRRPQRGNAT